MISLLHTWRDPARRSAAEQMALDEALFRIAAERGAAVARFYAWEEAAATVGYFAARERAPAPEAGTPGGSEAPPVRRLTGGGRVEHGEDLTFLLAVPAGETLAAAPGPERYRFVHEALLAALLATGVQAALLPEKNACARKGPCFANPVPWDLLDPAGGAKIGGGAQRRSRGALIHQGSIRLPADLRHPEAPWIEGFLARLAGRAAPLPEGWREEAESLARILEATRYGSPLWNRPRTR